MENIDVEVDKKRLSVGTRAEMASATSAQLVIDSHRIFFKYILAAGALLVLVAAAQFGLTIVAISLEKEIFVNDNDNGSGAHLMQDRAGNVLATPAAVTKIDPYESLPLAGPEVWGAMVHIDLLSEDGALHGFKFSGWRLDKDKTEEGAYQLSFMTATNTTLTYARSIRPLPAVNAKSPFEWASSGDNMIRIQHSDGSKTQAWQEESRRRLQMLDHCKCVDTKSPDREQIKYSKANPVCSTCNGAQSVCNPCFLAKTCWLSRKDCDPAWKLERKARETKNTLDNLRHGGVGGLALTVFSIR